MNSDFRTSVMAIVTLVTVMILSRSAPAAIPVITEPDPDGATLVYDPAVGDFSVQSAVLLQAIEVRSEQGLFIPENVNRGAVLPPFDQATFHRLFKLGGDLGVRELEWGNVLPAGLPAGELANDLSATAIPALGDTTNASLLVLPEPSSGTMVFWATAAGLHCYRRIRRRKAVIA